MYKKDAEIGLIIRLFALPLLLKEKAELMEGKLNELITEQEHSLIGSVLFPDMKEDWTSITIKDFHLHAFHAICSTKQKEHHFILS